MRYRYLPPITFILTALSIGLPVIARIKLITLPARQRVEIQLDHPSATLIEEERIVPLVKGLNQVDFSWANTRIDPQTIVFRVLAPAQDQAIQARVLSVSYPPNENALVWQVAATASGSARVRISYLLGGLTKRFHYRAVASADETTLTLSQYIRMKNLANEAFGASHLRAGYGNRFLKPIGLNETKQVLVQKYTGVPVTKTYTCDPNQFGYTARAQNKLRVPMHYVLTNDKTHHLGQAPLRYGKVRLFQDDGRGSVAFIGEDWGQFTPIDDQMRLYVGVAQDIVVKRTVDRNVRHTVAGNLHHREAIVKYEIQNFKTSPVTLDVSENLRSLRDELDGHSDRDVQWQIGDQTTFEGGADKEETTHDRVLFHVRLPARHGPNQAKTVTHLFHCFLKNEW